MSAKCSVSSTKKFCFLFLFVILLVIRSFFLEHLEEVDEKNIQFKKFSGQVQQGSYSISNEQNSGSNMETRDYLNMSTHYVDDTELGGINSHISYNVPNVNSVVVEEVQDKFVANNENESLVNSETFKTNEESSVDPGFTQHRYKLKILLVAYTRSGSSYVGELLTSLPTTAYYFEPLIALRPNGTGIERLLKEDPSQIWRVKDFLTALFNCSSALEERFKRSSWTIMRSGTTSCRSSSAVVIKTIRLHKRSMESWIYQSDIKVVHLVRDPRGIISSVFKSPKTWGKDRGNPKQLCTTIKEDMEVLEKLRKESYFRVRYEDIVDNPLRELEKLYKKLGLPFTEEVKHSIHSHNSNSTKRGYFNTYRRKGFRSDEWRNLLAASTLQQIEQACSQIMHKLNYHNSTSLT